MVVLFFNCRDIGIEHYLLKAHIYRNILMHMNAKIAPPQLPAFRITKTTISLFSYIQWKWSIRRYLDLGLGLDDILLLLPSSFSSALLACLAFDVCITLGVHEKGNNQAVKPQDFGENQN